MHQEAGTLLNHPHGEAIVEGHARKGQVDVALLEMRHDQLVDEMEKRGFNHDSPFEYDISEYEDMGDIDVDEKIADLRERCDDCAARMD